MPQRYFGLDSGPQVGSHPQKFSLLDAFNGERFRSKELFNSCRKEEALWQTSTMQNLA
jgi:hypothetical protein